MSLHGVDVSGLGESEAVVFLREGFASGSTAGERNAEFAGEPCGEGLEKHGIKERGIFDVRNEKQADGMLRAVNAAPPESPGGTVDLQHAQTVGREIVGFVFVTIILWRRDPDELGSEAPSVRAEDFAADRMIVRVAESGRGISHGCDRIDGWLTEFGEGQIADAERRWGGGLRCGIHCVYGMGLFAVRHRVS